MIFCYSGTGNSAWAARNLLAPGERLIPIRAEGESLYAPAEGEKVGFVFPVYFYGLPDSVRRFAGQLRLATAPAYTYAVITCGGSIAGAGGLLKELLAQQGIRLDAVFELEMPDNYVLLYDVPTPEKEKAQLMAAQGKLAAIQKDIAARRYVGTEIGLAAKLQTAVLYPWYDRTRKTAKFYADHSCKGCGACAAKCPVNAIEMRDGKPHWVKEKCDHCLSCLGCPSIQFGKRTVGKRRYIHPDRRK